MKYLRLQAMELDEKEVLVCLGERKRSVSYTPPESNVEEKKVLLDAVREVYADVANLLRGDLVLQVKNETWGQFIDLEADKDIPNKTILRIVSEVCCSGCDRK